MAGTVEEFRQVAEQLAAVCDADPKPLDKPTRRLLAAEARVQLSLVSERMFSGFVNDQDVEQC